MNERLEKAVSIARALSSEDQDAIASAMMTVMGVEGEKNRLYRLSDEENAAIDEALAEADRGEFASEDDVKAALALFRR